MIREGEEEPISQRVSQFSHLSGHPMHYFSQPLAGALANRI